MTCLNTTPPAKLDAGYVQKLAGDNTCDPVIGIYANNLNYFRPLASDNDGNIYANCYGPTLSAFCIIDNNYKISRVFWDSAGSIEIASIVLSGDNLNEFDIDVSDIDYDKFVPSRLAVNPYNDDIFMVCGGWPPGGENSNLTIFKLDNAQNKLSVIFGLARKIDGKITVEIGDSGDGGSSLDARSGDIGGIALDNRAYLYFTDEQNNKIRAITPNLLVFRVAGDEGGLPGFSGDGGFAIDSKTDTPKTICNYSYTSLNRTYFYDSGNNRIRMIDENGFISTIAGNGNTDYLPGYTGDGGLATDAPLLQVSYMDTDLLSNLFINQTGWVIRKIDNNGIISRIAYTGNSAYSGDGGDALLAENAGILGMVAQVGNRNLYDGVNIVHGTPISTRIIYEATSLSYAQFAEARVVKAFFRVNSVTPTDFIDKFIPIESLTMRFVYSPPSGLRTKTIRTLKCTVVIPNGKQYMSDFAAYSHIMSISIYAGLTEDSLVNVFNFETINQINYTEGQDGFSVTIDAKSVVETSNIVADTGLTLYRQDIESISSNDGQREWKMPLRFVGLMQKMTIDGEEIRAQEVNIIFNNSGGETSIKEFVANYDSDNTFNGILTAGYG